MSSAIARIASSLVLTVLHSGTSSRQKKSVPVGTIPIAYVNAPAEGPTSDGKSLAEWWKEFKDQELQSLIERGIRSNLDVRVARAKLRKSRATPSSTRRSLMIPTVDIDASYTNTKTSTDNPSIPKLGSSSTVLIPKNLFKN